jgi:hypothetical protein
MGDQPRGIKETGFERKYIPALVEGILQQRVLDLAPSYIAMGDLHEHFEHTNMSYWHNQKQIVGTGMTALNYLNPILISLMSDLPVVNFQLIPCHNLSQAISMEATEIYRIHIGTRRGCIPHVTESKIMTGGESAPQKTNGTNQIEPSFPLGNQQEC